MLPALRSALHAPLLAAGAALLLAGCTPALGPQTSVYDAPYPVRDVQLPADDAAHDAPFEWWYWVGYLETADGRDLAFQLTFFEAFAPPEIRVAGLPSNWWIEKEMVAHAAVHDLDAGTHAKAQRGVPWDGSASRVELDVAMNDWRAVRAEDGVSHHLSFTVGGTAFDLVLTPEKPASLHGERPGIQTMGPGGVSYYVSHTRMAVEGTVAPHRLVPLTWRAEPVTGEAWFDHQWGDFRIDAFAGWDWFAMQFDDGTEAMLYLIRAEDGSYQTVAGSVIDEAGATTYLTQEDVVIEPTGAAWTSDATGATYPVEWDVRVPDHDIDVRVTPRILDSEMDTRATTGIVYWEGAVTLDGSRSGRGFVELTNYDRYPFDPGD